MWLPSAVTIGASGINCRISDPRLSYTEPTGDELDERMNDDRSGTDDCEDQKGMHEISVRFDSSV